MEQVQHGVAVSPTRTRGRWGNQRRRSMTICLNQLVATGTHRVSIDTAGPNLGPATPFQSFVDAEDQGAVATIKMLATARDDHTARLSTS